MRANELTPGTSFKTSYVPGHVFTVARPIEQVGDVLLVWVEGTDGPMSLMTTDEVTIVSQS